MAGNPGAFFRLGYPPQVKNQIQDLASRARKNGTMTTLVHALKQMIWKLMNRPLEGEPKYRTQHPGGIVFQEVEPPLVFHYAVYQTEKTVLLLDVVSVA